MRYKLPLRWIGVCAAMVTACLTLATAAADDWTAYGRTLAATRYAPITQITPQNVKQLQVAWTFRTGDLPGPPHAPSNMPTFEATPLKIGDTLYVCTPHNIIIAIDAASGTERWRYDTKPAVEHAHHLACRGVSYYAAAKPLAQCQHRILAGTMDARLVAVDADTGKPCSDFGNNGSVDLTEHLGPIPADIYGVTSPPLVVRDVVVVSGLVNDNQAVSVPSGVVRAYDAVSGKQLWAYDSGRADTNPTLGADETYTRGAPNAWSVFSADEQLGLIYLPTGGASPDYFGGYRNPAEEKNGSAVVALDIATGQQRWVFQTVHHDLWDFDVASQPVLIEWDTPSGKVPALIQGTKRGELFVLDRRDGHPLSRVEERPVPQGAAPGDHTSPTQPFSVDMPYLGGEPLSEASMWGLTPLDMLWCRKKFKSLRYDGIFTPPTVQGSLHYPSNTGAMNWGSVSIDEQRQILIVNTMHIPTIAQLVPRDKLKELPKNGSEGVGPMTGTPYAAIQIPFLSPLGIPCNAPPWGKLTAVDLKTKRILWQQSLGNIETPIAALPLGTPNIGGSVITQSGVVFIAAALDNWLRAFDIKTGQELWRSRLPAGGQATPMTYIAERNGRQYIVIAAGGHAALHSKLGDYVIAFALPDTATKPGRDTAAH